MKQKNVILMVVAVGCGLVAAFLTTQINAKPKTEMVEVWVAAADMPVGTLLSKADLPKQIVKKPLPKEGLPPNIVIDENELVDKRLSTSLLAGEPFVVSKLSKTGVIILPPGKDMVALQMSVANSAAGFVGPGSKVDVLATLRLGNTIKALPLLVDMHVLAIDTHTSYDTKNGAFPNMSMVSFAVTQEQALLLALAKQRGCHLELLLRHPNKPLDLNYDIKKVKRMLEDTMNPTLINVTAGKDEEVPNDRTTSSPELPVKPVTPMNAEAPPPMKIDSIKVLVATESIAPNTEITKDLIAQKFKEIELPKQLSNDALGDLSAFEGQFLKSMVGKGQWVTPGMIGAPAPKPAPQDEFTAPKPGPVEAPESLPAEPSKPDAKPVVADKKIRDVSVHTASGTLVYRFEEVRAGEWKLKQVLSPQQATKQQPQTPADSAAETPEKTPEAEKAPEKMPEQGKKFE
jgi:Flp pilus assembly protein CpaB